MTDFEKGLLLDFCISIGLIAGGAFLLACAV